MRVTGLRCRRLRPVRWRGNVISTLLLKRRQGEGSCPRGLFGLPAGIPRGEALPRLCGLIRRGAQLLILGGTAPVSRGRGRACRRDRGLSSRSSDRLRGNRWPTTTNCTRCRRRTAPRPHSPSGRNRGSPGRDKSQTLTRVNISIVVSGAFPARSGSVLSPDLA